jgi:hypothetical protein
MSIEGVNPVSRSARKGAARNPVFGLLVVLLAALAPLTAPAWAQGPVETINLSSGAGPVGGTDPGTTMLVGPSLGFFPQPLTGAQFAAAASGPNALIQSPHGAWISTLPADPAAKWIGSQPSASNGNATLFAAPFFVTLQSITSATFDLWFAVDNGVDGIYFNGTSISSYSVIPAGCTATNCGGGYSQSHHVFRSDIGPLLTAGSNTLYISTMNDGGPSGLIFSATVNVTGSSSPEFQSNTVLSTLTVNGVWGNAYTAAAVTVPVNTPAMLSMTSMNIGMAWELGLGLLSPIPASAGALMTSDNQILNLNLTDPAFSTLWNLFQSPPFQNTTIPFAVAFPVGISAQMLVTDPYYPSGVAISQPVRLTVQ